jgi:lipid-A-disaccharide synthase
VRCVGHHLADKIPHETPKTPARKELGLNPDAPVICLMPGSRGGEVERMGPMFLETAQWLLRRRADYQFVIPAASVERRNQLGEQVKQMPLDLPVTVVLGQSRTCIAASDAVLVASGTATLEVMLLKRPMVVSYKVNQLTAFLLKRMLKQPYVSLPNLLAGKALVPEILQDRAIPMHLSDALINILEDSQQQEQLHQSFQFLHRQLQRNADVQAADALAELIES